MLTDYHCHLLPGLDDGAKDMEMSMQILEMLKAQGVERIVATPHFYAHKEKSVADFIRKRQEAFNSIKEVKISAPEIILGAEVAVEHGVSEIEDIDKLRIEGTDYILLELPYRAYADWMTEEIYNIACEYKLTPVIAHVHRYLEYYSKSEMDNLLETDAVFQVNNEAFGNRKEKKIVKTMIKNNYRLVFGSDTHNMSNRKPNFDILLKKVKPEIIKLSNQLL